MGISESRQVTAKAKKTPAQRAREGSGVKIVRAVRVRGPISL